MKLDHRLPKLRQIVGKGLPRPDDSRSDLYIWLEIGEELTTTHSLLLEILNYDGNYVNVEF